MYWTTEILWPLRFYVKPEPFFISMVDQKMIYVNDFSNKCTRWCSQGFFLGPTRFFMYINYIYRFTTSSPDCSYMHTFLCIIVQIWAKNILKYCKIFASWVNISNNNISMFKMKKKTTPKWLSSRFTFNMDGEHPNSILPLLSITVASPMIWSKDC